MTTLDTIFAALLLAVGILLLVSAFLPDDDDV
jgi:hypothetical protein